MFVDEIQKNMFEWIDKIIKWVGTHRTHKNEIQINYDDLLLINFVVESVMGNKSSPMPISDG